jgi:hypothetical protein
MRERDNTTRTGAKDPWGREAGPLAQRLVEAWARLDTAPGKGTTAEAGEGECKLSDGPGMPGAGLLYPQRHGGRHHLTGWP